MILVNDGTYRHTVFILRRFVNGNERLDGVFPVIEKITDAFASEPELTLDEFAALTNEQYLSRLNNFYLYLEFKYPFFDADKAGSTVGEDLESCPLDYSIRDRFFLNLELVLFEVGNNREARVDLVLRDVQGNEVQAQDNLDAELLVKYSPGQSFQDWPSISGETRIVTIPSGNSRTEVEPRFRYKGEGENIFNIKVRIMDVLEGQDTYVGRDDMVYTKSTEPFFLTNLISNLDRSEQDEPGTESLQNVIDSGDGFTEKNNAQFIFQANVKGRPVFLFPASEGSLSAIRYVQENNINILDANAFGISDVILEFDGEERLFTVYWAKNLIIYPYRVDYKFEF